MNRVTVRYKSICFYVNGDCYCTFRQGEGNTSEVLTTQTVSVMVFKNSWQYCSHVVKLKKRQKITLFNPKLRVEYMQYFNACRRRPRTWAAFWRRSVPAPAMPLTHANSTSKQQDGLGLCLNYWNMHVCLCVCRRTVCVCVGLSVHPLPSFCSQLPVCVPMSGVTYKWCIGVNGQLPV